MWGRHFWRLGGSSGNTSAREQARLQKWRPHKYLSLKAAATLMFSALFGFLYFVGRWGSYVQTVGGLAQPPRQQCHGQHRGDRDQEYNSLAQADIVAGMSPETVVDGLAFPECPRWHDGTLYFSDMHDGIVWSMIPGKAARRVVEVPACPAGLGWLPDGTLQIVSMTDRRVLRLTGDGLVIAAEL